MTITEVLLMLFNSSKDEAMQLNVGDKVLISLKVLIPLRKKMS